MRQINKAGLDLIKSFEGCKLKSYQDQKGIWTIGYGHVDSSVGPDTVWTQEQADAALLKDLEAAEKGVEGYVLKPLTDNQFSACVSLAFNIGVGAFSRSTLCALLNRGWYQEASLQFVRWAHVNGLTDVGLLRRRRAEQALFDQS